MRAFDERHLGHWENDEVEVRVPFSAAGVSTTVILNSKFTGKLMLLDVGDGVLRDLLSPGSLEFVEEIAMLAITHGHFDHMGGLYSLLGFLRMTKRESPLDILVPEGCIEVAATLSAFREVYGSSMSFTIRPHDVRGRMEFDTDFFRIAVFDVLHYGMENQSNQDVWMPAVGYRVHVGDTVIAYTGDTKMCPELKDLIKDADLAIIEATSVEIKEGEPRVHLTDKEARQLGTLARDYILIHRAPRVPMD